MNNQPTAALPDTLAAVDLGSNSFHMIIARVIDGQLHTLDRLRESVQLGAGLTKSNQLNDEVQERGLACLQRFGQRLRTLAPGSVRVVGTNTLRLARNTRPFLEAAQTALGHPIEIIEGDEEARLIYLGVAHSLAAGGERRLVIDIGGGSSEFIIGENYSPLHVESLEMGCVSYSLRHFPRGVISRENMLRAEIAARQELQAIVAPYRKLGWKTCIGASGTINAVAELLRAHTGGEPGITDSGLRKLRKQLIALGDIKNLGELSLRAERAAVIPGGLAVLLAAFESLQLTHMAVSDGALREGLLYDLLGRIRHEDIREQTVSAMSTRYHVDPQQAARVEHTALALFRQAAAPWSLQNQAHLLGWAALVHEIGLAVNHNQFQRHGAYLLENSAMPGFSREDQQSLAALILGQRGKFPLAAFDAVPTVATAIMRRLCILLRLAVLLNRSRSETALPRLTIAVTDKTMQLKFPKNWLDEHPLTHADLMQEAKYLKAVDMKLAVN